jgi:hypothetical protein
MSWLRSLLITSIIGAGIALVIWLVSMITGESNYLMAGILIAVFAFAWFWVHRGMNDPELHSRERTH